MKTSTIRYFHLEKCSSPLSFPFLPSPSPTCCVIVPTSFGGKGAHLKQWLVSQPSSDGLLDKVFWGFPKLVGKCQEVVPNFISLSPSSLANRYDWCDTWCKWLLDRNPDRSLWHHHTSIKHFGCRSWLHEHQAHVWILDQARIVSL